MAVSGPTVPFNSLYFVVFLAAVLLGYHVTLRGWTARKRFLLAASWGFYATWSPHFLLLLGAVTWIDFHLARRIHAARWQGDDPEEGPGRHMARRLLVAGLVVNLGALGFFKYGTFFYGTAAALVPLPPEPGLLAFAVPLGISFYVLHAVSYLVDAYRGVRAPSANVTDFALYLAFFPQLIAGPITRWGFFGPQLESARRVDLAGVTAALGFLASGYLKKVVCADGLGAFVDEVYAMPAAAGQLEVWLALYAYAFQVYFDFSGYTDIAWGAAGLLGFRLPENFRHPYLAESPAEFWRRWHISLSNWLRDYIFLPLLALTGNRTPVALGGVYLIVTMTLAGLWHGAAWTFVLWGTYHGVLLAAHRLAVARRATPRTPPWLRRLVTFHLLAFGLILFRAGNLDVAAAVSRGLWSGTPLPGPFPVGALALVVFGVATHALALHADLLARWRQAPLALQGAGYAAAMILVGLFSAQTGRFIYFAF